MYHILLPIDRDENRATAVIEAVLELPGSPEQLRVTVLNVKEKVEVDTGDGGRISTEEMYDESDFPESVLRARERLEEEGIQTELRREHDDPSQAIIRMANELDVDQVAMSGRKQTKVGKVIFGSVTQSVLLNSEVPVTVVMV